MLAHEILYKQITTFHDYRIQQDYRNIVTIGYHFVTNCIILLRAGFSNFLNFDNEEIESITKKNKINPEKEQKTFSPFLPSSCVKSYSETQFDVTTFYYTWKIKRFRSLSKIVNVIESQKFPETNEYHIEIHFSHEADKNEIKLYLRTQMFYIHNRGMFKTFHGFCTTTVMDSCKRVISSKSISGCLTNMTSLITISKSKLEFKYPNTLIIHCKFKNFVKPIHNTIHLNLYPTALKVVKSHKDSIVESDNESTKDEESVKFIVGEDQYVVSTKLLRATKSSYFTCICRTHEGKEKNMTNDLITNNELQAFKQILLFILSDSILDYDYDMLKTLLTAAEKYDVQTLKLTCEHYLLRYVTIENALELMQLAFSSNATFLETHLATFIKFHIKEITKIKEFLTLLQKDSNKMVELIEKSKILEADSNCTFVKTCEEHVKK